MNSAFLYVFGIWNVFVFVLYGIDKYKAVKNRWRISEKFLLTCAFFMGSLGAAFGMGIFRHKTRKPLFKIGIPVAIFINCAVVVLIFRGI